MVTKPVYMRLKKQKSKKRKYIITSLHPSKCIDTPLNKKFPMLTIPLNIRLLSSQNYSPFLSQMTKGKSLRGHHLIITGKGDGEAVKPPRWACCRDIQLAWVFTWHISLVRESRWASMLWSCTMMASRVTPPVVEVEVAEEEGIVEVAGLVASTRGHFSRSWALLRQIELALMGMERWRRIHVIAKENDMPKTNWPLVIN